MTFNDFPMKEWDGKTNYKMCIYAYVHRTEGKAYVGYTKDFKRRHVAHLSGRKTYFDLKLATDGISQFKVFILEDNLPNISGKISERERYWAKEFNAFANGYNKQNI